MNQTSAAILVLAASVFSCAAYAASHAGHPQASTLLTLASIAIAGWGLLSLMVHGLRERELLIDTQARADAIGHALVRDPIQKIKKVAQAVRTASPPPVQSSVPIVRLNADLHHRLESLAAETGQDKNQLLDQLLRQQFQESPPMAESQRPAA